MRNEDATQFGRTQEISSCDSCLRRATIIASTTVPAVDVLLHALIPRVAPVIAPRMEQTGFAVSRA